MQLKDEETRRLQEEVELARRQQQEASEALLRASAETQKHNRLNNVFDHDDVNEFDDNSSATNGEFGADLTSEGYANVPQTELDRITATEKNAIMRDKLAVSEAKLIYWPSVIWLAVWQVNA